MARDRRTYTNSDQCLYTLTETPKNLIGYNLRNIETWHRTGYHLGQHVAGTEKEMEGGARFEVVLETFFKWNMGLAVLV